MDVYDLSEENELDTYISWEVPVPEGDEAKILTRKELGQGQEDHCWFNQGSNCTTISFPKDTKDVLTPWISYLKGRTYIGICLWENSWRIWRSRMQRPYSHNLQESLKSKNQLKW